ncbi:MAG: hypothetical protein EDM70_08075 [Candidatus Brocadia sp. AMX2]|nr:MAG: hypothetical protein EDM70_08075 [Candidatus Brocadia sp. AMX2]
MRNAIIYIPAYMLFMIIHWFGYICKAEPNMSQICDFYQKIANNAGIYSTINTDWSNTTVPPVFPARVIDSASENQNSKLVVAVIENRFIVKGVITDIQHASKDIQKFSLQIKKIEPCKDYPNFGNNYAGKIVEIFSEIGIPSSFQIGMEVRVILRVSGDECGQTLFFVEVIESGAKN